MLHNTYLEMLGFRIYRHFNIRGWTVSRSSFEDLGFDRFCM